MTNDTKSKLSKYISKRQCQYGESKSYIMEFLMRKNSSPNREADKEMEKKIKALNKALARLFNELEKDYPELLKNLGL